METRITEQLDPLDRKILGALENNSRLRFTEIGRELKASGEVIAYRYDRLRARAVILNATTLVDPYRFGMTICKSYLRLGGTRRRREAFLRHLEKSSQLCWFAQVQGAWDVVVSLYASGARDFQHQFGELIADFCDLIIGRQAFFLTYQETYPRKLHERTQRRPRIIGVPGDATPDELDRKILTMLSQDSRKSVVEIGQRLKTPPNTVAYRIEALEKQGVIAAYVLNINHEMLGLLRVKVAVHLQDWSTKARERLKQYLRSREEVTAFIEQVGSWELEFETELPSISDLHVLLDDIRERFGEVVRDFETLFYRGNSRVKVPSGHLV